MSRHAFVYEWDAKVVEKKDLDDLCENHQYSTSFPIDETRKFAIMSEHPKNPGAHLEYVDNLLDFYRKFAEACMDLENDYSKSYCEVFEENHYKQKIFCSDDYFLVKNGCVFVVGQRL